MKTEPVTALKRETDYEFMLKRMQLLERIARGEKAIQEGKTLSQDKAKERMSKWLK